MTTKENKDPELLGTSSVYPTMLRHFRYFHYSDLHLAMNFNLMMKNHPCHAKEEDTQFSICVYHLFVIEETCSIYPTSISALFSSRTSTLLWNIVHLPRKILNYGD